MPPVLHRDVLRQARLIRALRRPRPCPTWSRRTPATRPRCRRCSSCRSSRAPRWSRCSTSRRRRSGAGRGRAPARRRPGRSRQLHALAPLARSRRRAGVGPAEEVDRWCRSARDRRPALAPGWDDVAAALLATGSPRPMPAAIVHGDFRLGNLLAVGADVTAVIDWEIWTRGRPTDRPRLVPRQRRPRDVPAATRTPVPSVTRRAGSSLRGALGRDVTDIAWFQALACFKSTATWSLIVKHNRRRAEPDPDVEAMARCCRICRAGADDRSGRGTPLSRSATFASAAALRRRRCSEGNRSSAGL